MTLIQEESIQDKLFRLKANGDFIEKIFKDHPDKEVFEDILADKAAGNPGEITERLKSISKPLTEPIINLFSKIKNGSGKFMREVGLRVQ